METHLGRFGNEHLPARTMDEVENLILTKASERIVSLDAFRGIAIAGMFLVNNPGTWNAVYPPLAHAKWNGWTFADTIYPSFLFIVGVSMMISFAKRRAQEVSRRHLAWQIIRRSSMIFGVGLLMHSVHYNLATLRIPGVLQRIALCYAAAGFIALGTTLKGQIGWILGLLTSYWLMMKLIPVPGIGTGVLEPGQNLATYVDNLVLSGHSWQPWDTEGIVPTLPAIATTLFGVLAGHLLLSSRSKEAKSLWLGVGGILLISLGLMLDVWLPINKSIWTSTYSIFMAGVSSVAFAALYWIIDIREYKRWASPLVTLGMNAIALYVLAGALNSLLIIGWPTHGGTPQNTKIFLFESFLQLADPVNASFLFAFTFLLAMYVIAVIMKRMRWFVRL